MLMEKYGKYDKNLRRKFKRKFRFVGPVNTNFWQPGGLPWLPSRSLWSPPSCKIYLSSLYLRNPMQLKCMRRLTKFSSLTVGCQNSDWHKYHLKDVYISTISNQWKVETFDKVFLTHSLQPNVAWQMSSKGCVHIFHKKSLKSYDNWQNSLHSRFAAKLLGSKGKHFLVGSVDLHLN